MAQDLPSCLHPMSKTLEMLGGGSWILNPLWDAHPAGDPTEVLDDDLYLDYHPLSWMDSNWGLTPCLDG